MLFDLAKYLATLASNLIDSSLSALSTSLPSCVVASRVEYTLTNDDTNTQ